MMSFKNILVPMSGAGEGTAPLRAAFVAAAKFDAHVEGLHVRADAQTVVPLMTDPMGSPVMGELVADVENRAAEMAEAAHAQFEATRQEMEVPLRDAPTGESGPSAAWHTETGSEPAVVAQYGRLFDLIVGGRADQGADPSVRATLEAALLETGRPLLVVPPEFSGVLGKNITVGWNRSTQSARALAMSGPFLDDAEKMLLVGVRTGAKLGPGSEDLSKRLAWHGVTTTVKLVEPDYRTVAEIILAEAAEFGADLVVTGAYSHSRIREMIFGGVTSELLSTTTLPVLMSR